ncbi:MAG: hypothetical protein EBZ81_16155 [Betaproteobacteria bacterium]|nr:hypothetical protein [Betaproteobacteria bacterium]
MSEENFNSQAGNQLRDMLFKDIVRYAQESDMTAFQAIGVLESLKYDLLKAMEDSNNQEDSDNESDLDLN